MKPGQTMREIQEKLYSDLIRWRAGDDIEFSMPQIIEGALTQVAKQAREETIEDVLGVLHRMRAEHTPEGHYILVHLWDVFREVQALLASIEKSDKGIAGE